MTDNRAGTSSSNRSRTPFPQEDQEANPRDDAMRAHRWAFRYCTWGPPGDPTNYLPPPFAGRISPIAFSTLLMAVIAADQNGTLPTLRVDKTTFAGMVGRRDGRHAAAVSELESAGLISIEGNVWTLRVDEDGAP